MVVYYNLLSYDVTWYYTLFFSSFCAEGYVEDYRLAQEYFETVEDKQEIYMNLKTGAESGLDYST